MSTQATDAPVRDDPSEPVSTVQTDRLVLRRITPSDHTAVARLAGDWQVARMLADMPHPMNADLARQWAQAAADDHALAITLAGEMIGSVSVCALEPAPFEDGGAPRTAAELGFWLGRPWWGYGYAREAAGAVISGLIAQGAVTCVRSGHFTDNPASGRVLSVLGFEPTGTTHNWCVARQQTLPALRYELRAPASTPGAPNRAHRDGEG